MLKIAAAMGEDGFSKFIQTLAEPVDMQSETLGLNHALQDEVRMNATQSNARSVPNRNTFDGACFNCNNFGHRIAFCPYPLKRKSNNNYNQNSNRQYQSQSSQNVSQQNTPNQNNNNGSYGNRQNNNNNNRQYSNSNQIDSNQMSAL